ncbi:Hypothetical protein CM240_3367 [Clostridium bornimense]|uniref:Uncharacterized protein n=1 Tax=Clostridium bornimense TaxID=1216932 RepID=W6S3J4_9CLOT|nr:signal peptidase II [Clostridium bornimense]CDM70484.1 Hypothetical protein CM240_3367 [Clostridium bornimense]
MKKFKELFILGFLIVLDQTIKVIIYNNFFYDVIKNPLIGFRPNFNEDISPLNVLLRINIPVYVYIIIGVICSVIGLYIYLYMKKNSLTNIYMEIFYILLLAGIIDSVLDKIFWGTSLDYIELFSRFIIDLKDIYIVMGAISFSISMIKISKNMNK